MNENLFEVLCAFRLDAKPVSCEPYGCGHINVTYLAVTESGRRYILQKINSNTFRDVAGLMENITAVTEFLRTKTDDPRGVLTLVKTHDGASYLHAQDAYLDTDKLAKEFDAAHPAAIVENDCVIVTGESLLQAFDRLEVMELTAASILKSQRLGRMVHISDEEVAALKETYHLEG